MPDSHRQRRTSLSSDKSTPHHGQARQPRKKKATSTTPDMVVRTDPVPTASPPPPTAPSTAVPKPAPTILKTTYNTRRIQRLTIAIMLCSLVAVAAVLWSLRQTLSQLIHPTPTKQPVVQLQVPTEKIDESKVAQINQQLGQPQSSSPAATPTLTQGAEPSPSTADPSIPTAEVLATYSYDQLQTVLDQQIDQLQTEGQEVGVLQSLKERAVTESASDAPKAMATLREAILLGQEFQRLYLYYQ